MAFHPFVLRAPELDTPWPTAGQPVFALVIDDSRFEYWDPQSQRDNVLRRLLIRAFVASGESPDDARRSATERIIDLSNSDLSITEWRARIKDGLVDGFAKKELEKFLANIITSRQRDDYRVDYTFLWLGVAGNSLIHRRLKTTYARAKIMQATVKVSGAAKVAFPPSLCPVYEQRSMESGRLRWGVGALLWWDAYEGQPCETNEGPNTFMIGRVVAVSRLAAAIPSPFRCC